MTKRPTSIRIMGIQFRITEPKRVDENDSYGECDGPKRVIKIKAGLSDDDFESTLLHEIIHASLYLGGQSERLEHEQEEGLVVCLESALSQLYQRKLK